MCVHFFICLLVCLLVCLLARSPACLPTYLPAYLSACPFVSTVVMSKRATSRSNCQLSCVEKGDEGREHKMHSLQVTKLVPLNTENSTSRSSMNPHIHSLYNESLFRMCFYINRMSHTHNFSYVLMLGGPSELCIHL